MKRVLLVGNGAREHVLAETLKRSPSGCELGVFANANNPGIEALASSYFVANSLLDFDALRAYARAFRPDFAFIGPDDPLGSGAADALLLEGVQSVGPLKVLAQLESSKSFTRDLLKKYGIPGNPKFRVFTSSEGLQEWMEELVEYVVKADGLMGGKGVQVSGEHLKTIEEGMAFAEKGIQKFGRVVVEEKFVGEEFSLMSFVDGMAVVDMPAVQDHKRAYEGDTGPNTGGMGTYSDVNHSLPFLQTSDLESAHEITLAVMKALYEETGQYYKGIMYGGFMAVRDGVRLIEYNVRFGDPEAMNVLPLLKTDFLTVCEAIIAGKLGDLKVEFEKKATVVKYVVPQGYPEYPQKGEKIEVGTIREGVRMYYGSVDARDDGLYLSSSRALGFVGMGSSLVEAEALATAGATVVKGPVFYRRDIGTETLIKKRVTHMKVIRT